MRVERKLKKAEVLVVDFPVFHLFSFTAKSSHKKNNFTKQTENTEVLNEIFMKN